MSSLKLQCEEVGILIPPAAGTWARNDLFQWASVSCTTAASYLPRGKPLQDRPSTAEQLAYDYLEAGHTSLWTAMRQVLQHLQYDPLQRFHHRQEANGPNCDKGQVFRVGAFFRVCRAC